jgi:hypothetical protein
MLQTGSYGARYREVASGVQDSLARSKQMIWPLTVTEVYGWREKVKLSLYLIN